MADSVAVTLDFFSSSVAFQNMNSKRKAETWKRNRRQLVRASSWPNTALHIVCTDRFSVAWRAFLQELLWN